MDVDATRKPSRIETYYDQTANQEWVRADRHPMEFATTWRAMQEHIMPDSAVLDIGGGPGRYSIRLAQAGHRVTLLDLSGASVDLARAKAAELGAPVTEFVRGDALDLSGFPAESFDVALLMGPLYHLTEEADRHRAIQQALAVLRPGGLLFAAFITRQAFLVDSLKYHPEAITTHGPREDELLERGVYIACDGNQGFTDAYFAHPLEVEPLMRGFGLQTVRIAAAEPLVALVEQRVNELPREAFERWVDLCYRIGTDPVTWGSAEHMLYVGRKTG